MQGGRLWVIASSIIRAMLLRSCVEINLKNLQQIHLCMEEQIKNREGNEHIHKSLTYEIVH